MDMFFAAVLCYSIGILTLFAPHHMQMMAHYVANLAAVMGSGLVFFNAWSILAGDATIRAFRWGRPLVLSMRPRRFARMAGSSCR